MAPDVYLEMSREQELVMKFVALGTEVGWRECTAAVSTGRVDTTNVRACLARRVCRGRSIAVVLRIALRMLHLQSFGAAAACQPVAREPHDFDAPWACPSDSLLPRRFKTRVVPPTVARRRCGDSLARAVSAGVGIDVVRHVCLRLSKCVVCVCLLGACVRD
jgi:hypothetical protein